MSIHWNCYQQNTQFPSYLNGDKVAGSYPEIGGRDVSSYQFNTNQNVHSGEYGIDKHPTVHLDIVTEINNELK